VARTVQTEPPAPSERPPSRFQSPAIRNVDPSSVSVIDVQCLDSSVMDGLARFGRHLDVKRRRGMFPNWEGNCLTRLFNQSDDAGRRRCLMVGSQMLRCGVLCSSKNVYENGDE
jgi:hypothetical protein